MEVVGTFMSSTNSKTMVEKKKVLSSVFLINQDTFFTVRFMKRCENNCCLLGCVQLQQKNEGGGGGGGGTNQFWMEFAKHFLLQYC